MTKLMKIALFASALAAASLPAQARLSEHELWVLEARLLASDLVYEKHCGPLGPESEWEQKRLSEISPAVSLFGGQTTIAGSPSVSKKRRICVSWSLRNLRIV